MGEGDSGCDSEEKKRGKATHPECFLLRPVYFSQCPPPGPSGGLHSAGGGKQEALEGCETAASCNAGLRQEQGSGGSITQT